MFMTWYFTCMGFCAHLCGQELPTEDTAMADYISGGIYFSGIGNGTDFSTIVEKLKKVESIPLNRMKLWKSDWNKRYEAFGEVISTVRDAKAKLTALNNPQKFLSKVGTSSNENILTVKAGANAVDGAHTIKVEKLASNAIWASNATFDSKNTSVNATGSAQDFSYVYKGQARTVSVPAGTSLESFVNLVNQDKGNLGVKVSLINTTGGYTFQVQGKDSGAAADLSILPSNLLNMGGGNTTWISNAPVADPTASFASQGATAVDYTYTLTHKNGSTETVTLKGDFTQQDLADAVNAKFGPNTAKFVGGNLIFSDITEVTKAIEGGTTSRAQGTPTTAATFSGALTDPLGTAGTDYTYTLTNADGTTKDIVLDGGKTRQDLIDAIKREGYGVTVTGDASSGYSMNVKNVTGISGNGLTQGDTKWSISQPAKATDTLQLDVVPRKLTFTFMKSDGNAASVSITNDKTMDDLVSKINQDLGAGTASLTTRDGKQYLQLNNISSAAGFGIRGHVESSSAWAVRNSCDAVFRVDNWPQALTSSSNEVTDVLEGVTLTFKDVGTSQISIAADKDAVKENIQTVLDTINSVIKKVQDLTKWDEKKQLASSNPKDANYSPSQWDKEKGGLLTGNYGVQLFNTRIKTLASGTPPGFTSMDALNDLAGDFVATLGQMGIKTCSNEGNASYGLLMIAPPSGSESMQVLDQERFDKAISEHLDDVISFFAADDSGSSSSSDFRYASHVKGQTKAGTYSVSYTVGDDGSVSEVLINGVRANESDTEPGVYTVGAAGNASGLSIKLDNLAPGSHSGTVSIKQGKIRQMEDFFTSELVYYKPDPKVPSISENNGALMILHANYKQIMDNIDKKIDREQSRLDVWERTQKLAFSRLETLLGNYDRSMQSMSGQLAKLGNGSS